MCKLIDDSLQFYSSCSDNREKNYLYNDIQNIEQICSFRFIFDITYLNL